MSQNTNPPNNKQGFWIVLVGVLVLALLAIGLANKEDKVTDPAPTETAAVTTTTETATTDENGETATTTTTTTEEPAAADEATAPSAAGASQLVAKVDGVDITKADVDKFLDTLPPQMKSAPMDQIYPMVQEQLVTNAIIQRKADAAIKEDDPVVQERLADVKEQIIRGTYLEREIDGQITPERLQQAYDEFKAKQQTPEEVHARHILVKTDALAKEIIGKLEAGEDFAKLAGEYTEDAGTKASGGDLGYFTKDMMVPEFADAAFGMNKGEVSKLPVQSQFGWHIIKVEDKRTRPQPSLDEVKPTIEAELRRELFTKTMDEWRKGAKIELYDVNGQPTSAGAAAAMAPTPAPAPAPEPVAEEAAPTADAPAPVEAAPAEAAPATTEDAPAADETTTQ